MRELGDLESGILLAVLRERGRSYALEVRRAVESVSGRPVSRGAFYTTMERLAEKGLVAWDLEVPTNSRRDLAQRRYRVTRAGLAALRDRKDRLTEQLQRLAEAMGG